MDKTMLVQLASEARKKARVPNSGFRVGAALVVEDGTVITGCNVELANTLSSICAERTAIVKAVSMGYQTFTALAVVSDAKEPISPCGFCRQYLVDFALDIPVYMANDDLSIIKSTTTGELMPMPFLGKR